MGKAELNWPSLEESAEEVAVVAARVPARFPFLPRAFMQSARSEIFALAHRVHLVDSLGDRPVIREPEGFQRDMTATADDLRCNRRQELSWQGFVQS